MKNWKNVLVYSTPLLLAPLAFAASCTNKDDGKKDAKIAELTKQYEEISKQLNTLKSELEESKKALEDEKKSKSEEVAKFEEIVKKLEEDKKRVETLLNNDHPEYLPTKQVLDLKNKVEEELNSKGLLNLLAPSQEDSDNIIKILEEAVKEIDKIDQSKLTADGLAWLNGIKYNWEIEIGNHKNGLRYLLSSFNWGPSSTYVANSFYGNITPRTFSEKTAKQWLATLKEAVEKNIVPSKIFIKNNIQYIIKKKFAADLGEFLKGTANEITVKDLIQNSTKYSGAVKDFYLYYVDTYYKASSYGKGEDIAKLKLTKTNALNELENTIELKAGKVYGLGLTQRDLEQTEAGLGYIPGTPGVLTGKEIYAQISKMNTTTSLTPAEVYAKGMNTSLTAATNMQKVAEEAAKLIAGTTANDWTSTIMYDEDGPDPKDAKSETLEIKKDGVINLENFNKWLNAEDFFFGREKAELYSATYKQSLDEDTSLDFARAELTKFGYDHLKGDSTKYNSITNDQFYYGAMEAFKAYQQFKKTTQTYGATFFSKSVPDYEIQTYPYVDRAYEGVGAYDSGVMKFMFNADPYFSLPKWSVTSFANHESMMGHHNQIMYAQRYLSEVLGMKLGNVFDYTSYVEGWALFMEWFGIEAGFYGTPNYADTTNYYSMPTSFDLAKGITNFFITTEDAQITAEQISQIKNLHGGVYWEKVNEKGLYADEKAHAKAAVKLANMLQYYGALNEAQLRNMRLAVDSIYHAPDIAGQTELPKGASILQARAFMKKNSALGLGDIQSESKRYFNCVGQAISYNSGKEVMLDLYKAVHTKLGYTRQQFVEDHKNEIQKFFDWLLRNGALPVETLRLTIKKAYNIN